MKSKPTGIAVNSTLAANLNTPVIGKPMDDSKTPAQQEMLDYIAGKDAPKEPSQPDKPADPPAEPAEGPQEPGSEELPATAPTEPVEPSAEPEATEPAEAPSEAPTEPPRPSNGDAEAGDTTAEAEPTPAEGEAEGEPEPQDSTPDAPEPALEAESEPVEGEGEPAEADSDPPAEPDAPAPPSNDAPEHVVTFAGLRGEVAELGEHLDAATLEALGAAGDAAFRFIAGVADAGTDGLSQEGLVRLQNVQNKAIFFVSAIESVLSRS